MTGRNFYFEDTTNDFLFLIIKNFHFKKDVANDLKLSSRRYKIMLAYYAHNHGAGHCNYAFQFAAHIPTLILTSRKEALQESMKMQNAEQNITLIPDEDLEENALPFSDFPTPSYLHYAPFGMKKSLLRYQKVVENFLKYNTELLIVDVSVEMATFARIIGVPYVYVKMMGNRNDKPHLYAYEGAAFLIAFYPESLEAEKTPDWVKQKTLYMGFFSKFSQTNFSTKECFEQIKKEQSFKKKDTKPFSEKESYITILKGFGGNELSKNYFQNVQKLFPKHKILVVGKVGQIPKENNFNFIDCGIVESTYPYIKISDLIIGACGSNSTSEIVTVGKKFLMTPEERPFEEQLCMADGLEKMNVGWKIDLGKEYSEEEIENLRKKISSLENSSEVKNNPQTLSLVENSAVKLFASWIKSKNLKDKKDFVKLLEEIKKYRSVSNLPIPQILPNAKPRL